MAASLVEQVRRSRLLPAGGVLVAGVSGGADSLALLHALNRLQPEIGYSLHAATLDHGLRGQAGAADAHFVIDTCVAWGIPVTSGTADAGALAKTLRKGIEEAARLARYRFLADVAAETGATHVAVGHHADDQAETVLMHVIRGAGLRGLGGMRARSPLPGAPHVTLLRPLLGVTRAQIEAYCREHGLQPRHDSTNDDTTLFRNRLRYEVLPLLRRLNPRITRVLGQLGDLAAVDDDFIEQVFRQTVLPHVRRDGARRSIPRDVFRDLHPALQRRLIVWAASELADDPRKEAGYVQTVAAARVGMEGATGAKAELPGEIHLRVAYDWLVVEPRDAAPPEPPGWPLLPENSRLAVAIPGVTPTASDWRLYAAATPPADRQAARLAVPAGARAWLRTRQPGDRFAPLGMGGHRQKIKAWMIDRKVPPSMRDRVPLLEIDGDIAAIIYGDQWSVSERFAARTGSAGLAWLWIERDS